MAGWTCVAILVALAVNQPVGHLVGEARPYITHPAVLVLADPTTDYAFPSDHAVMAGTTSARLLLVWRRLGMAALVAALWMALTRVYIGAHYRGMSWPACCWVPSSPSPCGHCSVGH